MSKANKSNKAIKYRLYPNDEQKVMFAKTFGCCRFVYNQLLALQKQRYKDGESHLSKLKSNEFATRTLKKDYDFLKEIDKFAVSNAVFHLADAYDRFFKKQNHFPKFKSKRKSKKSYTTNFTNNNILIGKNVIKLPKVGVVKAVIHKLAKEQRRLSRKAGSKKNETKSSNYFKQMRKVNRIYRKIANQRLDSLHKKSTEIANQYDVVCVEDLDMKAIGNKGFGNGKATFDNGYGMFLNMLDYKLKERGKYFVKVDKWYPSSQICHCCGSVKKLDLKDRVYTCDCGYTGDRDHNAAINILTEGLRILQSL